MGGGFAWLKSPRFIGALLVSALVGGLAEQCLRAPEEPDVLEQKATEVAEPFNAGGPPLSARPEVQKLLEDAQRALPTRLPLPTEAGFADDNAPVYVPGTRQIDLGPPTWVKAGKDVPELLFFFEVGGLTPSLAVRNNSQNQFLARIDVTLHCWDKTLGEVRTEQVTLQNIAPQGRGRANLEPGSSLCENANPRRLEIDGEHSFVFATTPASVDAAALSLFGLQDLEREAASVDFVARYFTPRAGRALVLLASRGNPVAVAALRRPGDDRRKFLLEALAELEVDESFLSVLLRTPDQVESLARMLPALGEPLWSEAVATVKAAETRWPQLSALSNVQRARAHDRYWPQDAKLLETRRSLARVAIIGGLALSSEEEVAPALVNAWAASDERTGAAILSVLAKHPDVAALAVLQKLSKPTGAERRFIGTDLMDNALEGSHAMRRALERLTGGAVPWTEARRRFDEKKAARIARVTQAAESAPTPEKALALAKLAVSLGAPASTVVPSTLRLASEAEKKEDFEVVHQASEAVMSLDPDNTESRALRERAEAAFLRRLFDGDLLFEGPGPEYTPLVTDEPVAEYPLPPKNAFRVVQLGPALLFAPPDRTMRMDLVFARLESADRLELHVPGARWFYLRALATKWLPRFVWWLIVLGLGGVFITVFKPSWTARACLRLGAWKWGGMLARRLHARFKSPAHSVLLARVLVHEAERELETAQHKAKLNEAKEALELNGGTHSRLALGARIDFLGGDVEKAIGRYRQLLRLGSEERVAESWLRMARLDLARAAFAARDDEEAIRQGSLAGREGRLIEGLARLRSGKTQPWPFVPAALWGHGRHAARVLLAHSLIELGQTSIAQAVLLTVKKSEPRLPYAQARLLHAQGLREAARTAYATISGKHHAHGGAGLGLAMLEAGELREKALRSIAGDSRDVGGHARTALAREAIAKGDPKEALTLLGTDLLQLRTREDAELVAVAHLRLSEHAASARAFARAEAFRERPLVKGRRSREESVDERPTAVAAKALLEGDARGAMAALGERGDALGLRRHAGWGLLLDRLRASPAEGFDAAVTNTGCGLLIEATHPPGVPKDVCLAVGALATGDFADVKRQLQFSTDALSPFLVALLSEGSVSPRQLRRLGERARMAHPSVDALTRILEVSYIAARGDFPSAHQALAEIYVTRELGDPATVARAIVERSLPASGDPPMPGPLTQPFALAAQGRYVEAGAQLDELVGRFSRPLLRVRLGWASAAAKASLASKDLVTARQALADARARILLPPPAIFDVESVEATAEALHAVSMSEPRLATGTTGDVPLAIGAVTASSGRLSLANDAQANSNGSGSHPISATPSGVHGSGSWSTLSDSGNRRLPSRHAPGADDSSSRWLRLVNKALPRSVASSLGAAVPAPYRALPSGELRVRPRSVLPLTLGPKEERRMELLLRAIDELSSENWLDIARESAPRALALFESRTLGDDAQRAYVRHDRAILAVADFFNSDDAVLESRAVKCLLYVDELMRHRATLAQYRLRALELAGQSQLQGQTPLEDTLAEKMTTLLASTLTALLDTQGPDALSNVLATGIASDGEGVVHGARRVLEKAERDALILVLAEAKKRSPQALRIEEARVLWSELEQSVKTSLERLESVGATEAVQGDCIDQSVQAMDALSIEFHARFPRSGLPVEIVDHALTLTRAEWLRIHLEKNRHIMTG